MKNRMTISKLMVLVAVVALLLSPPDFSAVPLPIVPVAMFGAIWLSTVVSVRYSQWCRADPEYLHFDPGGDETPRVVSERTRRAVSDLAPLGFVARGHVFDPDSVAMCSSYQSVFENRRTHETALLATVMVNDAAALTFLEFGTEYADGTGLVSTDHTMVPVTPPVARHEGSMSYPQVVEAAHLYRIHRAVAARHDGVPIRRDPLGEDVTVRVRHTTISEIEGWVEVGYYYLDGARRLYRPTWKGAFLMTGKHMWPVGAIRRAMGRRRAAGRLREWGLDQPDGSGDVSGPDARSSEAPA